MEGIQSDFWWLSFVWNWIHFRFQSGMNTKSVTITPDSGYTYLPLRETITPGTDSQCYWLCIQCHLSWYSTQTYFSCIFDAFPIVFLAPDTETIIQVEMKSTDLCFDFADGQTAVAFVPLFERTLIWLWWTLWSIFKHRRQRKTFLRYWRSIWKCGNGSDGKEFYFLIEKDGVGYTICKTLLL